MTRWRMPPEIAAPLLIGVLVASLVAARVESALLCVVLGAALAVSVGAPRLPARAWRLLGWGAAIAIVLNMYLVDGRDLGWPRVLGRTATLEGVWAGVLLSLRLLGATLAGHVLHAIWPGERAADEIARRLRPLERLRVPIGEARMIAALALRFAPLLRAESNRIARLQEVRAGRPARGTGERLTRQRARLVPAMVAALERAERVGLAMEARHFRSRPLPDVAPAPWSARIAGVSLVAIALLWRA